MKAASESTATSASDEDEDVEGLAELHAALGYKRVAAIPPAGPRPEAAAAARPGLESAAAASAAGDDDAVGNHPPLTKKQIAELRARLDADPQGTLADVHRVLDRAITLTELRNALQEAETLVHAPREGAARLKATAALESAESGLPPGFTFDGMDENEIRIDFESKRFEKRADLARWIFLGGLPLLFAPFRTDARFVKHTDFDGGFVYARPEPPPNGHEVALFSDFGTGLYHARYIAKQLRTRTPAHGDIFHLGDVYYAGRESEFIDNFRPFIDPLLKKSPVWTLNSNHEMHSQGFPYYRYIAERRAREPSKQQQEGSYFCIRYGASFQIVAIDTAYHSEGRHHDAACIAWLEDVLRKGRELGLTTVLLSADEPYAYGEQRTTKLFGDLERLVAQEKLVDLWFWGNTHYCALFDRTALLPFVGSCIGHGGYPYYRVDPGDDAPAPLRFLETGARFPKETGIRQDMGNNGYVDMVLHGGSANQRAITLRYIDWMGRLRCMARLGRMADGAFGIVGQVVDHTKNEA